MSTYSSHLPKLLVRIASFFIFSYVAFELLFDVSNLVEILVNGSSASYLTVLLIIAVLISDILIPVPSSIVMVTSGVLFGGLWGGFISLIGSMAGSVINFQISRTLGQKRVRRWVGKTEYGRLSSVLVTYGAYIIILTRMVPLAMESVSSLAGISDMKLTRFMLLNLIGFVPTVFLYSFSGEFYKHEPDQIVTVLVVGFFVPLLLWQLLLKRLMKPMQKHRSFLF